MGEKPSYWWTTEISDQIGANLPTNKASGLDGVPDVILKHITDRKPELILGSINKCLQEGYFPSAWKEAKLVFLQKGNKPLNHQSSYRPICLISMVTKLFERVIKKKLELDLEQTRGISEYQFGFRRGRSTIDAINSSM